MCIFLQNYHSNPLILLAEWLWVQHIQAQQTQNAFELLMELLNEKEKEGCHFLISLKIPAHSQGLIFLSFLLLLNLRS